MYYFNMGHTGGPQNDAPTATPRIVAGIRLRQERAKGSWESGSACTLVP